MAPSLFRTRKRPFEAELAFIAATEILIERTDFRLATAASLSGLKKYSGQTPSTSVPMSSSESNFQGLPKICTAGANLGSLASCGKVRCASSRGSSTPSWPSTTTSPARWRGYSSA
jgi:hypothetical protein